MKMVAMMAGTLMVIAGCATTDPVQPATDVAASNVTAASSSPVVAIEAKGAKDPSKVRCERMANTGSRLGKSVCRTEEQWAAIERHADEIMDDLESKPLGRQE